MRLQEKSEIRKNFKRKKVHEIDRKNKIQVPTEEIILFSRNSKTFHSIVSCYYYIYQEFL